MKESSFQAGLIAKIKKRLPDAIVMKTNPNYIQGMPDLLVIHDNKWGALEVKKDIHAKHQPNQDYWVDRMNKMSFARFVSPENEEEVLNELCETL